MKQIKNAIENLISDPRKEDRRIERLQSDVERLAASVDNLSYQLQEQSDYISESTRDLNVFLERRENRNRNITLVLTWSAFFFSISCLTYFLAG